MADSAPYGALMFDGPVNLALMPLFHLCTPNSGFELHSEIGVHGYIAK